MFRTVIFRLCSIVTLMCLSTLAFSALTQTDLENFKYQCAPDMEYDLAINFAPVKKLAGNMKATGQWSYEYLTADKQFSGRQITLPKNGAARVDLVFQLNASDSNKPENYMWQVIAAPTVTGWKYGGHWATKLPVTAYQRLKAKRQSLITLATLSAHKGQPVHSKISPKDVDKSGTLNNAWADLFGDGIMDLVYAASNKSSFSHSTNQVSYSLTFYYVPTPALRFINDNGYKWPSFKHVDQPGTVFGFALTPGGDCLNWSSIDVVK